MKKFKKFLSSILDWLIVLTIGAVLITLAILPRYLHNKVIQEDGYPAWVYWL